MLFLKVYWKAYVSLFRPLFLEKKIQTRQYNSRENYYKLTSDRSIELKLWSFGGEFNGETNKFGFSTMYDEFQARFQGEKTGFRR